MINYNKKGFSLFELGIVISVMAIIAILAYNFLSNFTKKTDANILAKDVATYLVALENGVRLGDVAADDSNYKDLNFLKLKFDNSKKYSCKKGTSEIGFLPCNFNILSKDKDGKSRIDIMVNKSVKDKTAVITKLGPIVSIDKENKGASLYAADVISDIQSYISGIDVGTSIGISSFELNKKDDDVFIIINTVISNSNNIWLDVDGENKMQADLKFNLHNVNRDIKNVNSLYLKPSDAKKNTVQITAYKKPEKDSDNEFKENTDLGSLTICSLKYANYSKNEISYNTTSDTNDDSINIDAEEIRIGADLIVKDAEKSLTGIEEYGKVILGRNSADKTKRSNVLTNDIKMKYLNQNNNLDNNLTDYISPIVLISVQEVTVTQSPDAQAVYIKKPLCNDAGNPRIVIHIKSYNNPKVKGSFKYVYGWSTLFKKKIKIELNAKSNVGINYKSISDELWLLSSKYPFVIYDKDVLEHGVYTADVSLYCDYSENRNWDI